jgi:hypothetical protein
VASTETTAVFAKVGVEGIDSDFATLIRAVVIVVTLGALVYVTGKWQSPLTIPEVQGREPRGESAHGSPIGALVMSSTSRLGPVVAHARALERRSRRPVT